MATRAKPKSKPRQIVAAQQIQPSGSFPSVSVDRRFLIILAIIVIVALVGWYKKEWVVAAMVDGAPISNFSVLSRMNQQYRAQTVNQLVNEKIIMDEVARKKVSVSETEVKDKIAKLESSFGGAESLNTILAQQRQTRADLERDIRLQVSIEKLYASEATVSAEEIDKYIKDSKEQLTATDSAEQRKEAEEFLRQQKLSTILSQKFQELKAKAKVTLF